MGQFLNPDNNIFASEVNAGIYLDKSGLLKVTNAAYNTPQRFICSSRPRRFGKSYAADMLTAYYSRGCDSKELFAPLEIGRAKDFEKYLNRCEVIRFDVQWCRSDAGSAENTVKYINENILKEMRMAYPEADLSGVTTVFGAMNQVNIQLGRTFVVIIDEWDALIRDRQADDAVQNAYIDFLRGMFKGTQPLNYIRLAYITGILPIKRQKTESALNNFYEYTMLSPGPLAEYIGFTDAEVQGLCKKYEMSYEEVRRWYDGYRLGGLQVYNPNSVCRCMYERSTGDYWTSTASFESIRPYINMNFNGLKTALIRMISGGSVKINAGTFENHTDRAAFKNRDDVFTYLIHLGYLAYDQRKKEAFVPNEEIRQELGAEVSENRWTEFDQFERESLGLLDATIGREGEKVAAAVSGIHDRYASAIWYKRESPSDDGLSCPISELRPDIADPWETACADFPRGCCKKRSMGCNNENSLAATIEIGYLATLKYYFKPVREMPAGRGFADIVYVPRPEYMPDYPALVVELKWNRDAGTAIAQIRKKRYPDAVRDYTGDILLVGINYDKETKEHSCVIEEAVKTEAVEDTEGAPA